LAAGVGGFASAQDKPTAPPSGWVKDKIDLRAAGQSRITGVYHPANAPVAKRADRSAGKVRRQAIPAPAFKRQNRTLAAAPSQVISFIVDSPPLDGFIPWAAFVATDQKLGALELDAVASTVVGGSVIHPQPLESDYTIGLVDTGASISIMSHAASVTLGLVAANRITPSDVVISGVTGSVVAKVSQPIGLYMDGLDAIDPNTLLLDTTDMAGEYNVSIGVGQAPPPGQSDLPTVAGSPLAVFYALLVDNARQVARTINDVEYESPLIQFLPIDSLLIPEYPNLIPLELRPLGAVSVQYTPCIDIFGSCPGGIDAPTVPSVIIGIGSQSLFFLGSVDLYNGAKSAIDKDRFMLDTGAQVTVVGYRVGARLGLNPNQPQFLVELQGVDGQVSYEPGFYIDSIQIPALGDWLTFHNVPIVLLDVNSPEGGTLDGIIGMNLLTRCNFVLRGGGMFNQPDPALEYAITVPLVTDCDFDGDGDVDLDDFGHLQRCYAGPDTVQGDAACLDARLDADSDVDAADLEILTNCLSGANMEADADCAP